jgi:hypothetical protein
MSIDKVSSLVEQALSEIKSIKQEKGERGIVGEASAGDIIKRLWHETHFRKVEPTHGKQAHRRVWARNKGCPSLKAFARTQASAGNQTAKDWMAQKNGALDIGRSDKNIARVASERTASMASRRKKSSGKVSKATAEATAIATATPTTKSK